ncbi:nitrate ABC transporter permease [Pigmentiphaga litoralis]|uniref:nitrate ABC transporter permease n=1 Tax=Pigmentiphaga litoralis TaxID=516702 RepID=UPI003B439FA8
MTAIAKPLPVTPAASAAPSKAGSATVIDLHPDVASRSAEAPVATPAVPARAAAAPAAPANAAGPGAFAERFQSVVRTLAGPVAGFVMFILVWQVITTFVTEIPTPAVTWKAAVALFSDPFYVAGPNDMGIGWNVLASLQRVAIGFGLAAVVGIPVGFAIGRFKTLNAMFSPVISLLRPVSPLAWLPLGLLLFKAANLAAIWAIFICSIWPMIINTAVGVSRVPQDYMNVARVLNLSEWKIIKKVLLPAVLPYMLTGVRLSISTAWLVIVAAEMLTGGTGIGFWVWDEWNNLKVEHIIIAIFVIGIVGLLLEVALMQLAKRFTYSAD